MGYAMEQLPKKVQKLVKKLADLQRKQVEVMRCGTQGKKTYEELEPKINEQFEKGTKLVDELFSTQFATLELGVGFCEEDSFAVPLRCPAVQAFADAAATFGFGGRPIFRCTDF